MAVNRAPYAISGNWTRGARPASRRTHVEAFCATRPATGKYTVVFENRVAETLIGLVSEYFSPKPSMKTSPLPANWVRPVFVRVRSH